MTGSSAVFLPVLLGLALFGVGYIIIRLLKLDLPRSRSLDEFFLRTFWIYPSIDRRKVLVNKLAWLSVVFITYLVVTAVFS